VNQRLFPLCSGIIFIIAVDRITASLSLVAAHEQTTTLASLTAKWSNLSELLWRIGVRTKILRELSWSLAARLRRICVLFCCTHRQTAVNTTRSGTLCVSHCTVQTVVVVLADYREGGRVEMNEGKGGNWLRSCPIGLSSSFRTRLYQFSLSRK
jgi:hypothetical protein